ncbi:helix-turn-helix domain-containing protein [Nonomuraea sp. NPDC004186]|uniref:helix-turn-helix domain-containing protein n=1 Tax=Nonomuraea jabiensis TaxID=882448 RepID=UPI0035E43C30
MRYGLRGGYAPAEQERRERVRLQAAEWFEAGEWTRAIAARLRVHEWSVTSWRKAWREGGTSALRSKGPVSREKLSARSGRGWMPSCGGDRWPGATWKTGAGRWAGSKR